MQSTLPPQLITSFLSELEKKTSIPVFLNTNKDSFFVQIHHLNVLPKESLGYAYQYGLYFSGQFRVVSLMERKTFLPSHPKLHECFANFSKQVSVDVACKFENYAEIYKHTNIQDVFDSEEISFLKESIWVTLDKDFVFVPGMKFGDDNYRPFLRSVDYIESEDGKSYVLKPERLWYRKFHLLKFFEWINKQS